MDIRNLRLFMAVVKHGSISAAAQSLDMAQPVLSRHIRNLELELDAKVFDRQPRGVAPNASGRALIEATRSIEANYRSALRDLAEARSATVGTLRVGATASWLHRALPATVADLTTSHPSARITISRGLPDALINDLLKGRLDIVLAPVGAVENYAPLLDTEVIYRSRYAVVAAPNHPARVTEVQKLEDLLEWKWVLPRSAYARKLFDATFVAANLAPPEPAIELEDASAILGIVSQSPFLTFGDPNVASAAMSYALPCPALEMHVDQGCFTVRKSTPSPLRRLFIKTLRQQVGG